MDFMKRCIFYLPYQMDENGMGARMLRPRKMIQAFIDIGYEVYIIEGISSVRRKKIKELKKKILGGEKYDFMYTESHTEPTLLTDPHHMPTHPFLDFTFFRFVKKHGIRIGLFYCDIYWKFDTYGVGLPAWKRKAALLCYRYDIKQYEKYLDRFYVPDMKICDYLDNKKLSNIAEELPPGAEKINVKEAVKKKDFNTDPLTLFYVGGLGNQYQIIELVKAVYHTEKTRLILCCREKEWTKEKNGFLPYLCDRIHIIHKNSSELEEYYHEADLGSLMFQWDKYRVLAKPFKAYEYLAHEIPVLSTAGTAIGAFVEQNDIGWNLDFDAKEIALLLRHIIEQPEALEKKKRNCQIVKQTNLWITRASKVANELG